MNTDNNLYALHDADARAEAAAEAALHSIILATEEGGKDVLEAGIIYAVVVLDGVARVFFDDQANDLESVMASDLPRLVEETLLAIDGIRRVVVKPRPRSIARVSRLPGVDCVIGIHSVKGGVGKSTVCAGLALALAKQGLSVGLLDADAYGPSAGLIFGLAGEAQTDRSGTKIEPVVSCGVKIMSLAFLLPDDEPLIWRGNLVDEGIAQLFSEVAWGELDVLLVDMPPGTGDIPIAVAANSPLSGIIAVTAPSKLSVMDVKRGLEFFADIRVPILGLVENMASYTCDCGEVIPLFGSGGGALLQQGLGIPLLASLPFSEAVVQAGESGAVGLFDDANSELGIIFAKLARDVRLRFQPERTAA